MALEYSGELISSELIRLTFSAEDERLSFADMHPRKWVEG